MNRRPISLLFLLLSALLLPELSAQDFIRKGLMSSGKSSYPYGLNMDNKGNLLITGQYPGTMDMDCDPDRENLLEARGSWDIYVARYDRLGEHHWAFSLGGGESDHLVAYDIDSDSDGNVYICGSVRSWIDFDPGEARDSLWTGGNMFFIASYDGNGAYRWARVFGIDHTRTNISLLAMALDRDAGAVYVAGTFGDGIDFDPSDEGSLLLQPPRFSDFFLARYNSEGALDWAKLISGPEVHSYGSIRAMELDQDGNLYLGGEFSGTYDMDPGAGEQLMDLHTTDGYSGNDAFMASYNASGDYRWHMNLGSGYSNYVRNIKAHEGKLYMVGSFMDTVDFDPSGQEHFLESAEMESSGYLAVYDTDGKFQNAMGMKCYQGEYSWSSSWINDVDFDDHGRLYVIGDLAGTMDCDPGDGTLELTSTGGFSDWDMFLARYSLDLEVDWALNIGGSSQERGLHTIVNWGEVLAHGYFDGNCDFDPSEGESWSMNNGGHDLYLAWYKAYDATAVESHDTGAKSPARIYPMPAGDILNIESEPHISGYRIYALSGALLIEERKMCQKLQIDLSGLPPSAYLLQLHYSSGVENRLILKRGALSP